MPLLTLLGYLIIFVLIGSFAYWVIQRFVPDPFKSYANLVLGLVALIFIVYLVALLTGVGNVGSMRIGH